MTVMNRLVLFSPLLLLSGKALAFPLGLGYAVTKEKVDISETVKEHEEGTFSYRATYQTISILDYSGIVCAGFQNAHAQAEARDKAVRGAQYDTTVKPGDSVSYSWKAATPVAGTACGVHLHSALSPGKADIGGALPHGQSGGDATISGWTAFGMFAKPFDDMPDYFWKLHLMVDVREARVKGVPGGEDLKHNVFGMPFDYEVGRVINVPDVGGFMVWGSTGYDMLFWLLKSIVPEQFPTSFLRLGAGVGYQTPVEGLQVRLTFKRSDTGFDARGVKEAGYSLGVYYQM